MLVGHHILRRSYFLPLANKRRDTVLYLQRKDRTYRILRPGALVSPLPLYANLEKFIQHFLIYSDHPTSACTS